MNIIDYIPYGQENARTARELARITGLTERAAENESQLTVRWLRQEKHRNEEHRMSLRGAQVALYFGGIV